MNGSLEVGFQGSMTHEVTADMSPLHLPVVVLSTPSMVRIIEETCLEAVQRHLDEGETTVGTHICVSHTGPATEGEQVTVSFRLAEINRRRLGFEVKVETRAGTISEGTHERAVVDAAQFG